MRFCLVLLLLPAICLAQFTEDTGTLAAPVLTPWGLVCTNSFGSALYRVNGQLVEEMLAGPGVGRYCAVSPDGQHVGFKEIRPDGKQVPALLDLSTGAILRLSPPSDRVGQPGFAAGGTVGFTLGTKLIVTNASTTRTFELGSYANLAPLSPDGGDVVFNDADDALWLLNLSTGLRTRLTMGPKGYAAPVWSPDGQRIAFRSLDGIINVFDRGSKRTFILGRGTHPSWTPDGSSLVFSRPVIEGDSLTGSDLYRIRFDGGGEVRLTFTPSVFEMDPSVSSDGGSIVYHTYTSREVLSLPLSDAGPSLRRAPVRLMDASTFSFRPVVPAGDARVTSAMDIPYVHQVYDTPDWFNGHWACAPTQAIMVLAYYHILPPWNITCSWPAPHVTAWGNYVASPYRFRQNDFAYTAPDPNGISGKGGFGYMWTGTYSPHARMADYFRVHGMSATQSEATPYSTAAAEIAAGYPFSMCVLLTTAGHLVLAHGFGAEPHTLVFNDPYGNKNQGYMNAYGKNVMYDWPGYNNGYQNLNEVAWCIATRSAPPTTSDTLVDDLHFANGFTMATAPPASMSLWKDLVRGYEGHLWYAFTTTGTVDTFFAEWRPALLSSGRYEVQAFIELSNATRARYVISHASGSDTVVLDQTVYSKAWATLGTYPFDAGSGGSVRLGNRSVAGGQEIVFDAVRWVKVPLTDVSTPGPLAPTFRLEQNYPNPFNPSTSLRFSVPVDAMVILEVFNVLGQRVAVLQDGPVAAGAHAVRWSAEHLASGIYLARLRATSASGSMHQSVVRMVYGR